ncbi:hypothetical protein, partial [Shewanella algae]|uniref:hypothetical protein n=1 Tax=Shewanella algae TaxID=38313 RepID=UPI001F283D8D
LLAVSLYLFVSIGYQLIVFCVLFVDHIVLFVEYLCGCCNLFAAFKTKIIRYFLQKETSGRQV